MIDYKIYSSLLGGFIIYLVIGTYYLWANIQIYVISYFHQMGDPSITMYGTSIIFPCSMFLSMLGMPFGVKLGKWFGLTRTLFVEGAILSSGVFLSSFTTSFSSFLILYGMIFGVMIGVIQMVPIYIATKLFTQSKGRAMAFINSGFGFSSIMTNSLAFWIVNPNNVKPSYQNQYGESFFEGDTAYIALQTPYVLRVVGVLLFGMTCLGTWLIQISDRINLAHQNTNSMKNQNNPVIEQQKQINPSNIEQSKQQIQLGQTENQQQILEEEILAEKFISDQHTRLSQSQEVYHQQVQTNQHQLSHVHLTKAQQFALIWQEIKYLTHNQKFGLCYLMAFFSYSFGAFMASNYKSIGFRGIKDDKFLTTVGVASSLSNGMACLFIWGYLMDKIHFQKTYTLLLSLQMFAILTIKISLSYPIWFLLDSMIAVGCEAGHFVVFPALLIKIYGSKLGSMAFGFLFSSYCFSNFLQYFINVYIESDSGLIFAQFAFAIFTVISYIILQIFQRKSQMQ